MNILQEHCLRQDQHIASLKDRLTIAENDQSMTLGSLEEMKTRYKAQTKINEVMVAYIFPGQPPLPFLAHQPYSV